MAKVSVVTQERATRAGLPAGCTGDVTTVAYFASPHTSLHLFLHTIDAASTLGIGPRATDCLIYVWRGEIEAGGHHLPAGSSLVVEHGAAIAIRGCAAKSQLLSFTSAAISAAPRPGGHVHLLPADRVERAIGMMQGVNGGLHFDSTCPDCELWLHENEFTPAFLTPEAERRGPHSHTEDEIIFVTAGQMRLGKRLYGPGTALAIAARTMYSFNPGPDGLNFINFRAAMPGDILRADGSRSSETSGWCRRLGGRRIDYLMPVSSDAKSCRAVDGATIEAGRQARHGAAPG